MTGGAEARKMIKERPAMDIVPAIERDMRERGLCGLGLGVMDLVSFRFGSELPHPINTDMNGISNPVSEVLL